MALSADLEVRLEDADLITFFNNNRAAFKAMAKEAYGYAYGYVHGRGLPVRQDDVAAILTPALQTNELLHDELAEKKLRQRLWYQAFAFLVLERLWKELADEHAAEG